MARLPDAVRDFLSEIRRRRVGRVAVAYAVTAWVLVEVADTVFPRLQLPDAAVTLLIILVVAGFPVALLLAWWYDLTPDPSGTPSTRARLGAGVLLVLLLAAAGGAANRAWSVLGQPDRVRSLVVLPFDNLGGDPEQRYFTAGMYDALLGELAQLADLRTISKTSANRYRDTPKSVPEIARELDVDAVVEGSVERSGDRVRIRVQLVRAAPREENLWAEAYSRELSDVLVMHGDVARAIAERIESRLSPWQRERLAATPTVDPQTYEAYLRGMYHLNRSTPDEVARGLEYLHAAVDRDPADARAWAGLALGYATLGHGFTPPPDAWSRARAAAMRAVALEPTLPEAHAALADVKLYHEWDWEGAEAAFRRANELNPNLAMNHYHYAWFLALLDRMDEAIVEHRRAQELDPLEPLHTAWLAGLYNMVGRYEDAEREAKKALELVPGNPHGLWNLGDAYLLGGRPDQAVATHERLAAAVPPAKWVLGLTYARVGRSADARRIAAEVEAEGPTAFGALGLAAILSQLGDVDQALGWLRHEPSHAWLPWVRTLDWFAPLRDEPGFITLVEELRLPPPVEG